MKSSGYDKFFKQAQKNSFQSKGQSLKKKRGTVDPSSKKSLNDYSESELRKIFKMQPESQSRSQSRIKTKKKRKNEISLTNVLIAFCLMGISICIFLFPDQIEKLIHKIEIQAVGQASAAGQENTAEKEQDLEEQSSLDRKEGQPKGSKASEKEVEKDTSYFSKLNDRKKQLDLRERELEELEQELNKQKEEIEARIQYLETVRRDIAGVLKDRVEVDEEKVKRLVEFYSSMKPAQAAEIISTINEDLAIGVLANMKKKNAAAILNMIEPKKARKLSEKFAGYVKE